VDGASILILPDVRVDLGDIASARKVILKSRHRVIFTSSADILVLPTIILKKYVHGAISAVLNLAGKQKSKVIIF